MATEVMKTFSALQEELLKAKEGLKTVDSHIKRIIGRDPETQPPGQGPRPGLKRPIGQNDDYYARGRGAFQGGGRGRGGPPLRQQDDEGPIGIRRRLGDRPERPERPERPGTVFSRLSGLPSKYIKIEKDDDDFPAPPSKYYKKEEEDEEMDEEEASFKPAISSRVIPQTRELPSKQEIIAAQGDERSKARNRRMFGALLGTLQRFRQEESKLRGREDKRAVVEKKLEEAAKREKEEMKKEKQELFLDRRRKQADIRRIEFKILRVKEQDQWEARHRPLLNFIQTKAKPSIFYSPKIQNTKTEERLVASQKVIAKMMEKKRATIQEELDRMEGNAHKNDNSGEHQHEEGNEDMETENGPNDNADEIQDVSGDSPVENKENRLRSINVKVEQDVEVKSTISAKMPSEAEDQELESDQPRDQQRQSSYHRERRDQQDSRDHRDQREHDRAKDRSRHDREREKEKDSDRVREKDREKVRDRLKGRDRERKTERETNTDIRKDNEEKWDRKWDRHDSSDTNAMEEEEETVGEEYQPEAADAPELSSITLPGEQSSPPQPSYELDEAAE